MRVPTPLLLLPLVAACTGGFAAPVSNVRVEEAEVRFEAVRIDALHRDVVHLENTGTAISRVRLAVDGPFLVSTDAITLNPGASTFVSVSFRPDSYDAAAGTLTVTATRSTSTVELVGTVSDDWDEDGFIAVDAGGDDCDDLRTEVNPGAVEVCDGADTDCNGTVDDAEDKPTWWSDGDGDGFGADGTQVEACSAPDGYVGTGGDCDDEESGTFPGATEKTDGVDQDCDAFVDEHLLVPGSLLVTELALAPFGDAPPFVEVRARAGSPLHLDGVTLSIGDAALTLPPVAVGDCDVLLFCGVDEPDTVDGEPCLAPLPALPAPDQNVAFTAENELDRVDWTGWELPEDASLELNGEVDDEDGNDDEAAWAPSVTPMAGGGSATPGAAPVCGG